MSAIAGAIALVLLAGVVTGLARPTPRGAARANALVIGVAAVACMRLAWRALASGEPLVLSLPWPVPGGAFAVALDPLTPGLHEPLFSALASRFARLRGLQQGNAHFYLTYILSAVLMALAWVSWRVRGVP
jgi:hypothetical protein